MSGYMPGDRLRVTIEGTCIVGDTEHVYLQLDDGARWRFLPAAAKVEKVAGGTRAIQPGGTRIVDHT